MLQYTGRITPNHSQKQAPQVHQAGIKSISRMREKLAEYAEEGGAWPYAAAILDPVRLSIVVDGPSQIVQARNRTRCNVRE